MISSDMAETLALQVLGWLAGQEELVGVFLGSSGLSQEELKHRAAEPEFLAAVLDFVLMDDNWVMGACEAVEIPYERLLAVRAALPGGEQVHWT